MSGTVGKVLLAAGAVLVLLGVWILVSGRLPSWPSWIGRLPGDLSIERKNIRVYLPITTGLLFSLILTILLWLLSRR
ncbi:MAG: DUF2905 domain-containing protein [Nitrospirae bacterium]|nr:DUF2905 domain-containing protein [Nitrospirota bacterium]